MKSINFDSALGELDKNSDMIREYWRDLRASWQASENSLRRTLFYILALAATFLLLSTKGLGEVTFLGLKVTNLRLVATLIPAVIAYLIYVVSITAAVTMRLATVHDRLAQHYWPNFYGEDLEVAVRPVGSFTETALIALSTKNNVLQNMSAWAGLVRFSIYIIAPIGFEVYALWWLIGHNEEALWLECLVAAFLFLMILASVPNYIFITKWVREEF
jgi:hypothetical protein